MTGDRPQIRGQGHTVDLGSGRVREPDIFGGLAYSCVEMNKDYVFFTHATFFVHQGKDPDTMDPAVAWAVECGFQPEDGILISQEFNRDLFEGLPEPWSRTLFGVRRDYLDRFLLAMCGVLTIDGLVEDGAPILETTYTVITIPDPATGQGQIEVAVFLTLNRKEQWAIVVGSGPRPRFRRATGLSEASGVEFVPETSEFGDFSDWVARKYNPAEDAFYRVFVESVARNYQVKGKVHEDQSDEPPGREAGVQQGDG